jgi:hypothetical protein
MENIHYVAAKVSSYDPENGFKEWYELQAQPDEDEIIINMENINESNR